MRKYAKAKSIEINSLQKYHWVCFVVANYAWACGLHWFVVTMLNEIPVEKTYCSFASGS